MKNIKSYLLVLIAFVMFSCATEDPVAEKEYIYMQQIAYAGAVAESVELIARQAVIQNEIDGGNTSVALQQEYDLNIQKINTLQQAYEYIGALPPSIGPVGPVPLPPPGCLVTSNCIPTVNVLNVKGMVLHPAITITNTRLYDNAVNDVVGTNFIPGDEFLNQETLLFNNTNFTNITKFVFDISLNGIGTVTINVPITFD